MSPPDCACTGWTQRDALRRVGTQRSAGRGRTGTGSTRGDGLPQINFRTDAKPSSACGMYPNGREHGEVLLLLPSVCTPSIARRRNRKVAVRQTISPASKFAERREARDDRDVKTPTQDAPDRRGAVRQSPDLLASKRVPASCPRAVRAQPETSRGLSSSLESAPRCRPARARRRTRRGT